MTCDLCGEPINRDSFRWHGVWVHRYCWVMEDE